MMLGYFIGNSTLQTIALFAMLVYFLVVSIQYYPLNKKIKEAQKKSKVEISGSKWSFNNPLRVKLDINFTL